ncbi:MAG TPA: hypothetical protein VH114_01750 [Candidatus Acidoferrum sp.]|jgi:hypothetical protein|nr:hypothetical protein [Candidatus Acidoferrum sp.]
MSLMSATYPTDEEGVFAAYSCWFGDGEWQVVAKERIVDGKVTVISTQFLRARGPLKYKRPPEPLPVSTREIEYA